MAGLGSQLGAGRHTLRGYVSLGICLTAKILWDWIKQDCWAVAEVCIPLSAILVVAVVFPFNNEENNKEKLISLENYQQ